MSDTTESATPANGEAPAAPEAAATAPDAAAKAEEPAKAPEAAAPVASGPSVVTKLKAHPKVQHALTVAKAHPLGAVVGVAAAVAFVEVEFAVGVLTGIGATALLVAKSGPEARAQVFTRGKEALARARESLKRKPKPANDAAPPQAA